MASVITVAPAIPSQLLRHVEEVVSNMPYYYHAHSTSMPEDEHSFLSHILLNPARKSMEHLPFESRINSEHWLLFREVFDNILRKAGLEYTEILRAAVNATYSNSNRNGLVHYDHPDIDYKHIILTLNDDFSGGGTFLPDTQEFLPAIKNTAYVFGKEAHHAVHPINGLRKIAVFTYR